MSASDRPDPFFVLAECRDLLVRRLTELFRLTAPLPEKVLTAIGAQVAASHDLLAAARSGSDFDQTADLTASKISLVGNDELELEIRIDEIAARVRDNEHIDHWRVQLRYMALLGRDNMTPDTAPAGLEPLRQALWTLCREAGGTLDQQLDLLQRAEERLGAGLPETYAELNRLLEARGVQPAQVHIVQRTASAPRGPASTPAANPFAALQHTLQRQQGGDALTGGGPGATYAMHAGGSGNAALDASALVMLNHLIERLDLIERQQSAAPGSADPGRPLRADDLELPAGGPTAVILDTLSLIFEHLFAAPDLPDTVKTLLGRLQIPLLKRAIRDPGLFADTAHPARQLVDRIVLAATGLPLDLAHDHPMLTKLGAVADAARPALEQREGDLSEALADLDGLAAERDAAVDAAARPAIEAVERHERSEAALARAQDWLERTLTRTREPAFVEFLSTHWVRAMQDAAQSGDSAWQDTEAVIERLFWSIAPKTTAEARQQLTAAIPALIRQLGTALDRLGVSMAARQPFLDACFALQSAARRGAGVAVPPMPPSARKNTPGGLSGAFPPLRVLENGAQHIHYYGHVGEGMHEGRPLRPGGWIAFTLPDGTPRSGKLCWQGDTTRTLLVFNPDGPAPAAIALGAPLLAQQLSTGKARWLSGASPFDTAATEALRRLRGDPV